MEENQGSMCSDVDEPIVEITGDEEFHPSLSPYVLKPFFKFSAVIPSNNSDKVSPKLKHGDTVIGYLPPPLSSGVNVKESIKPFKSETENDMTPKKKFNSESNPHDLVRCAQKEKYIWYAVCDETMQLNQFIQNLSSCVDSSPPIVLYTE